MENDNHIIRELERDTDGGSEESDRNRVSGEDRASIIHGVLLSGGFYISCGR